jgi:hypothetical protein
LHRARETNFLNAADHPRGVLLRPVLKIWRAKNRSTPPPRGTSFVIPAFDSCDNQEAPMRFSMNSYLLGVGTVVGALTFGFGGGILLTKTAIKDTPSGPSRMERAARAEPAPAAPQLTEAKAVPVPRAEPQPAVQSAEPVRQILESPVQAAAEAKPAADVKAVAEPARAAEPVRQIDTAKQVEQPVADLPKPPEQLVRQADAPKPIEQPRQSEARQVEQSQTEQRIVEREQRRAEQRRIEREKRTAERKSRTIVVVRRQRPTEELERPARPELAFEREAPRPNLFEGLFGRAQEAAPGERE